MDKVKQNILIISGIFPPDIGGPATFVPKIAHALCERGHNCSVLTYSQDLGPKNQDSSFPVVRILRKKFILLREIKFLFHGFKLGRKANAIFVNGNDFKGFLIGLFLGKPRIHKVVGDVSWERSQNWDLFNGTLDEYQNSSKSILSHFFDIIFHLPLKRAKKIIVPSKYLKKIVTGWGISPEKIQVIYNGYSGEISNRSPPSILNKEPLHLVTVCRLTPWKGISGLLSLVQERKDIELHIIGGGDLLPQLQQEAKEKGVLERVKFYGPLDHSTTIQTLKKMDAFILNSSYEGLPHVVLEAMGQRLPVLASDAGGTSEVVIDGKTGHLFPPNDIKSMKSKIEWLKSYDIGSLTKNAVSYIQNNFHENNMIDLTVNEITVVQDGSEG